MVPAHKGCVLVDALYLQPPLIVQLCTEAPMVVDEHDVLHETVNVCDECGLCCLQLSLRHFHVDSQCHLINRMVANVLTDLMQVLMIFIRLDAMAQLLACEAAPVTIADLFRVIHEIIVDAPALAYSSLIPSHTDIAFTLFDT